MHDPATLYVAFCRVEGNRGANTPGVDGMTVRKLPKYLKRHWPQIREQLLAGTYRPQPVKRVEIPKPDGTKRPLGIPTFEDKVLQRAVAMVLNAVYEQDFLPCSYGFRPGRSAHQALQALWNATMKVGGGWVIEIDIRPFFDSVDHGHLRAFLEQRVRDGVIRRTIDKWLNAGVQQDGAIRYLTGGTPKAA